MRAIFTLLISLVLVTLSSAADRPNILWLTAEDMGPYLGCYGDEFAITPTLDAFAAKSLRFTNACSNAPVCAPARTTIITGLYPPSTGSEHMRSQTRLPAEFHMFPEYLREAGYYCTNNVKEDYNVAHTGQVWDESSRHAHWRKRAKDQPFFAVFNHTTTHESQIRNDISPEEKVHAPASVRIPAYHPDAPEVRRDWAQHYDRITTMDSQVAQRLKEIADSGLADDTIIFFFSDHGSGMPRHKRWLYRSGLHVPMIAYFPPKWRHLAPKSYSEGGTSDRLVSFIDLAPTTLSIAGIEAPSWMQGGAFAGQFTAVEPQYSYGFRSRMDERYDLSRSVRDKRYNYIRNYMPHRAYGQYLSYQEETPTTRVWRKMFEDGKLNEVQSVFWKQKPAEELYDLQNDPDEVVNLANSPEHADILKRLREAHRKWEHEIRDVTLLSEWEMRKRSKGTTPYEMGHDLAKYDFDAIFVAAQLASSLDRTKLPQIVSLLDDDDSGVRYWGAMGLLVNEKAGVEAGREKLLKALDDSSPMVQIVAAEALGRFGNASDAKAATDVLVRYTEPGRDYFLAIAAWNALDFLDDRARPALSILESRPAEEDKSPPRAGGYIRRLKHKTLLDLN